MEAWEAVKQESGTWLFTWNGSSGESFFIWLDGVLLATVDDEGEYECVVDGYVDAPPPLEIILDESTQEAQNELYPPRARFQWRESDGASGYQVEVWNGVNWITRATVTEADSGYYWYQTQALMDGVDYEYRVRAVDTNDNAGEPIEFEVNLVRNPAPPSVTIELDSAGDIVVEAL